MIPGENEAQLATGKPTLNLPRLCLETLLILGAGSVVPFHVEKEEEDVSIRLRKFLSPLSRRKKFPLAGPAQAKTPSGQRMGGVSRDM